MPYIFNEFSSLDSISLCKWVDFLQPLSIHHLVQHPYTFGLLYAGHNGVLDKGWKQGLYAFLYFKLE